MVASFAGFGFARNLLALADRLGLANELPLTGWFSLSVGLALTDMLGVFNIPAIVYVSALADTLTFADKLGLVVITIV